MRHNGACQSAPTAFANICRLGAHLACRKTLNEWGRSQKHTNCNLMSKPAQKKPPSTSYLKYIVKFTSCPTRLIAARNAAPQQGCGLAAITHESHLRREPATSFPPHNHESSATLTSAANNVFEGHRPPIALPFGLCSCAGNMTAL